MALANTLAAIDSGVLSLCILVYHIAKTCNHSCVLRDRRRPEAAFLLQLSDVLMGKSESRKSGDIIAGKSQISRAHHRICLLQLNDIRWHRNASDGITHRLLQLNDELTFKNGSPEAQLGTKQRIKSSLRIEYLCRLQNEAEHGNIKIGGQYLQTMIVLTY